VNRYELSIPGALKQSIALNGALADLAYVVSRRSSSLTPSFVLQEVSKGGMMAKMADKEVGALIGRPLRWTGGEGEIETFRSVMRLVRRQQRKVRIEGFERFFFFSTNAPQGK
jgi:hypothetical protein